VTAPEQPARSWWQLSLLSNQFPALHGLRVLAILSVVQIHVTVVLAWGQMLAPSTLTRWSSAVWFGMDLFFVLSGFLIGSILLSDAASNKHSIARFYARRAFRTIPLYAFVLFVLWRTEKPALPLRTIWPEFVYLTPYLRSNTNYIVMPFAWSLCVEEHFYLAAPLLLALLRKLQSHRARLVTLGALWVSALVIRHAIFWAARTPWSDPELFRWMYVLTHTRFDTLVAGVLLAYVHHHFAASLTSVFRVGVARLASYAIALAAIGWLLPPHRTLPHSNWQLFAWGSVTSIAYAAIVLPLLHSPPTAWLPRVLGARLWLPIATLGYGVYLVHIPLMDHIVKLASVGFFLAGWPAHTRWLLAFVLLCILSWSLAYVLHVCVEKPALRLRDRIAPPLPQ
jgi:peptidoglycan/LPS O-acetylase OafA/YrhL